MIEMCFPSFKSPGVAVLTGSWWVSQSVYRELLFIGMGSLYFAFQVSVHEITTGGSTGDDGVFSALHIGPNWYTGCKRRGRGCIRRGRFFIQTIPLHLTSPPPKAPLRCPAWERVTGFTLFSFLFLEISTTATHVGYCSLSLELSNQWSFTRSFKLPSRHYYSVLAASCTQGAELTSRLSTWCPCTFVTTIYN